MRVVVGRIGRAQGIRGEVTVEVRTDAPEERFSPGAVLLLSGRAGLPATITVEGYRWQNARLILAVEGIADRTAAETLRGAILEAEVDLTEAEEDEFHDLALVGLSVAAGRRHRAGQHRRGAAPARPGRPGRGPDRRRRAARPVRAPDRARGGHRRRVRRRRAARRARGAGLMRIDVISIFGDVPRAPAPVAGRPGDRRRPDRPGRPRPARLHPRPAPDRGRLPVRRGPGHGHEARAVGRGAASGPGRRAIPRSPVRLVVPTPSGRPFTQAMAAQWSTDPRLVFACGRYEGIDSRVVPWARTLTAGRAAAWSSTRSRSATTSSPVPRRPCS